MNIARPIQKFVPDKLAALDRTQPRCMQPKHW